MDMMETIELEDLKAQARQVLEELMEAARLKPGKILVYGSLPGTKAKGNLSGCPVLRTFKPCPDSGGRGSSGLRL